VKGVDALAPVLTGQAWAPAPEGVERKDAERQHQYRSALVQAGDRHRHTEEQRRDSQTHPCPGRGEQEVEQPARAGDPTRRDQSRSETTTTRSAS
jgi:hypothetical protein